MDGLIPAHAGKTPPRRPWPMIVRAHPRSRGENFASVVDAKPRWGSSPLTRGKRAHVRRRDDSGGLIPAHAGKTVTWAIESDAVQAHPRSRGENSLEECVPVFLERLIPAHAGKTIAPDILSAPIAAHPRSRGENAISDLAATLAGGSSPLTRGKRRADRAQCARARLIPAHAGKTDLF